MKTLQKLILLASLTLPSFLAAETVTSPVTLDDGTVIPAGSVVAFDEDGTVQYSNENDVILAQITTTMLPNGGREIIIIKLIPSEFFLAAETVTSPVTLDDGTVIPAGSVVAFAEDGTVQYSSKNDEILAQITSTMLPNGGREIIIIKLIPSGIYVRVRIVENPDGTVYGSGPGPDGNTVPNNPANVI